MKKLTEVIIRYEKARSLVSELTQNRSRLLGGCEGIETTEDHHGIVFEIGDTCGRKAWKYFTEEDDDYDITFEDAFLIYINGEEGACDKCREAYSLRNGALAEAKKEFGNAKRAMARLGKRLILESTK